MKNVSQLLPILTPSTPPHKGIAFVVFENPKKLELAILYYSNGGYNPERSNQFQQQGAPHHHDEQQLCGVEGECLQEVRQEQSLPGIE